MTNGELFKVLEEYARDYRKECIDSVNRNSHMNECKGKVNVDQSAVDAILVDYINYIAAKHGCDLAMYTKDLK